MKDPLAYVEALAERARLETPLHEPVDLGVAARLRTVSPPPLVRAWGVCAAGALALAFLAGLSILVNYDGASTDPILAMFRIASINL